MKIEASAGRQRKKGLCEHCERYDEEKIIVELNRIWVSLSIICVSLCVICVVLGVIVAKLFS